MYEQYYGLSAPPFQIHPDPGFYFESKGHGRAYQYLRFGAFQGEGFIVVTGEIGAGKTTLLRALLAELDPAKVVAAQLVSTQLGSDDLLSAVSLAFGIRVEDGQSKAKLLVTLEAFLATLATSNRRALLIIDEAQNLSTGAIEELRMLSNFQFGNQALLQSFLVGQPELREMLQQPSMEQLRQRVLASCHLGPMEPVETRGYIEHRLRRVGWQQHPRFDAAAFEAIHRATGGLPRRINTLCNRLLLSAFLDEEQHVDAERVRRVDLEMRAEVSGRGLPESARDGGGSAAPLLCVATSRQGLLAIGTLLRAFAAREDLPQVVLMRFAGEGAIEDDVGAVADLRELGLSDPGLCVMLSADTPGEAVAEAAAALAAQIRLLEPTALLTAGTGWVEAACATLAVATGLRLVRAVCGSGHESAAHDRGRLGALLEASSSLMLASRTDERPDHAAQAAETCVVGSFAVDAMHLALPHSVEPEQTLRREGVSASLLVDPAGYALVALRDPRRAGAQALLVGLDASLRRLGWRIALLCPVGKAQRKPLADVCAREGAGSVRVIEASRHGEVLGLLRHARCLLTDDPWLHDQATALGVPALDLVPPRTSSRTSDGASRHDENAPTKRLAQELADIIASGGRRVALPEGFDGHAAQRAAAFLSDWLLAQQDGQYRQFLQGA